MLLHFGKHNTLTIHATVTLLGVTIRKLNKYENLLLVCFDQNSINQSMTWRGMPYQAIFLPILSTVQLCNCYCFNNNNSTGLLKYHEVSSHTTTCPYNLLPYMRCYCLLIWSILYICRKTIELHSYVFYWLSTHLG